MTYYKPNTFFNQDQVLKYAQQMLINNEIKDVKIEIFDDLNAGFCGRLESNFSIFVDTAHTLKLNFAAIRRHALHFNINAHQFALSVIAHELGHYMDYEHFNGLKYADIVLDSTCPIEKQKAVIQLEKNAGRYGRRFVTEDFYDVFVNDNQRNIELHYNKLKNIMESNKVVA